MRSAAPPITGPFLDRISKISSQYGRVVEVVVEENVRTIKRFFDNRYNRAESQFVHLLDVPWNSVKGIERTSVSDFVEL
jgi:hypothetical protein